VLMADIRASRRRLQIKEGFWEGSMWMTASIGGGRRRNRNSGWSRFLEGILAFGTCKI
jgi:hypothetical protein